MPHIHKTVTFISLIWFLPFSAIDAGERLVLNFNPSWKFVKDDVPHAQEPDFDDRSWTTVSLPHTFNDCDTFDDWSLAGHRGEQDQWSGRTWYRKAFTAPESWKGKKVIIEFEAVRQVAEVYLNGKLLGISKTGFTPFGFDLTPHLRFGGENVLAVMCDNRFMKDPPDPKLIESANQEGVASKSRDAGPRGELASYMTRVNEKIPEDLDQLQADQIPWNNPHWHPAHGGIYRNVRLVITDPLHFELPLYSFLQTAGPYVYVNDVSEDLAHFTLEAPVENGHRRDERVELSVDVLDRDGQSVLTKTQVADVPAGKANLIKMPGEICSPELWQPSHPNLYHVRCTLRAGGEVCDTCELPLGIRTVRWDKELGFFINGQHLKLHGWGQKPTDEWPGLGAAQPDWLHAYTLELMKNAGANFVRWGHCAAGPSSIAAGDRLGVIFDQPGVDGESDTVGAAWKLRAAAFRDVLIYFRNNPSILIWEGGNQKVTREHAAELHRYVDQYDPHGGRVYSHRRADQATAAFMQIGLGTEGGREIQSLPVVEAEYDREESPRRVWDDQSPPGFGYPEAKGQTYQLTSEQFAVNQVTQYVTKVGADNHCGGANWIFSDTTSGGRVACEVARAGGEVDGVRLPKEAYYVCSTMFHDDPQVHIIGHWTYRPGTNKTVYVASNAQEVELCVNGKSLGRAKPTDRYLFTFADVAFEPGEIKAVAFNGNQAVATQTKCTVGRPVALKVTPIVGPDGLEADGSDVALFDVEAVDEHGQRCPTFQQRVDFEIDGPGVWRGGYNSGKINSINNPYLDLECGINRVAVRSTLTAGQITIRAATQDLRPTSASITSHPARIEDGSVSPLSAVSAAK
jgi:beta-galactosidase